MLRAHALVLRRQAPLGHEFFHQLCDSVAYPSFCRAHRSLDQRGLTLVDLRSSECHLTSDALWMLLQCQIEVTLRLHPRVYGVLDWSQGALIDVFILFLGRHVGAGELFLADVHLCYLPVGNLGAFGIDLRPERALVHFGALFLSPCRVQLGCPLFDVALQFVVVLVWG